MLNVFLFWSRKDTLYQMQIMLTTKEKIKKLEYITIKDFSKRHYKVKRLAIHWKNELSTHDNELFSITYKELL